MREKKEWQGILQEFKKFALKGNVLDLAVGVIIGGAFGKIVTSLVNDIIMPLLGIVLGKVNLSEMKWELHSDNGDVLVALPYGQFLQNIMDFLIISISIFFLIKFLNHFKKKEEEKPVGPPKPSNEEVLLTEIRDLLKSK